MSGRATSGRQNVVVLARPEAGAIELIERSLPSLGPNDVLLRVLTAGICGTDLHIVKWNSWAARTYRPPVALGHEFCAEIVDLGGAVSMFQRGDRVVAETHLSCDHCLQCRMNRRHTCDNLQVFSRVGFGAFVDFTIAPAKLLRRVPHGMSPDLASLFEPFGIALRAVRTAQALSNDLLVTGCGPIGLMTIAVARRLGAHRIIASDLDDARLSLALAMGADVIVNSSRETLRESLPGGRVAATIDASGSARAIQEGLSLTETGGCLVLTGLPEQVVPIALTEHVILREVSIRGIYGRLIDETWIEAETLLGSMGPILQTLLQSKFPLASYHEAFDCAQSGSVGKVLFDCTSWRP